MTPAAILSPVSFTTLSWMHKICPQRNHSGYESAWITLCDQ